MRHLRFAFIGLVTIVALNMATPAQAYQRFCRYCSVDVSTNKAICWYTTNAGSEDCTVGVNGSWCIESGSCVYY